MVVQKISSLLAMMLVALPTTAMSQTWPSRPIEWIVPFAPGGSTDVLARLLSERLKDRLGQPIVIVNRGGANADIGYKAAAAAPPDGHTIVLTVPSIVTNPFQLKSALEPNRLAPVVYLAEGPYVLLASKEFPATTIEDTVARVRSKPKAVSCGMTGGMGSLACQSLQSYAKTELVQVPYRGVEPAMVAVMAGDIDIVFSFGISATRPLESGRVRVVASTAIKRGSPPFPNLPTVSEVLPDFEIMGWSAVSVPTGTPPDIIARLNREFNAVLKTPEISSRLEADGLTPVGGSPDEFARRLKTAETIFGRVLKDSGVTPR